MEYELPKHYESKKKDTKRIEELFKGFLKGFLAGLIFSAIIMGVIWIVQNLFGIN